MADIPDELIKLERSAVEAHVKQDHLRTSTATQTLRSLTNLDLSRGSADGVGGPFRFPELMVGRPAARLSRRVGAGFHGRG
ncbi:hypothetical protein, partial [Streptomyces plumbiresistens]|uniref:hypothetical protein n=1 Tax=Streptomyces plumbiresistens TaxID=511811 RepID=UPI0031E6F57E